MLRGCALLVFAVVVVGGVHGLLPHQHQHVAQQFSSAFHGVKQAASLDLPCALCGILTNELQGLLAENRTVTEIQSELDQRLCPSLPDKLLEEVCRLFSKSLPVAIGIVEKEKSVSGICTGLGLCKKALPGDHPDPVDIPTYELKLDLDPIERWTQVCSEPKVRETWTSLVDTVDGLLGNNGTIAKALGRKLNAKMDQEMALEVQGCAKALGIDYGWVTLFQIGYEASDACTSIVSEAEDGTIFHARNLDFGAGMAFTDALKSVAAKINVTRNGETVFEFVTFSGFVGVLSGMRKGGFSVTVDTRFQPLGDLIFEIILAIEDDGASLVAFLTRYALEKQETFPDAIDTLSNVPLVSPVYFIVGGVSSGQGTVISRNTTAAANTWNINTDQKRWFLLQTNYDHDKPAPWFDDRRDPGIAHMNAMGRSNITLAHLKTVLSTKPTLNLETAISFLAVPKNGTMMSWARWCPYPCVQ